MTLVLGLAAFVLAGLATRGLLDPRSPIRLLDHPNARSLHSTPRPRTGGLAILAALAAALAAVAAVMPGPAAPAGWLLAVLLPLAGISFLDDRAHVPAAARLGAHLAVAAVLVVPAGLAPPALHLPGLAWDWGGAVAVVACTLFLVWMLNLYNFMDGMDGFAGGMGVAGFGVFAWLGWQAGHGPFAAVSLACAGAAGGFLLFNFPPARIFMGDVGSSVLGLMAGALTLWAARDGIFPVWVGVLAFSPFVVDATVTLVRRLARGERVWQAHRSHYYQRLVGLGWSHRRTVLWEYGLMAACAGSAALAVGLGPAGQWAVLGIWAAAYPVLMLAVGRLEAHRREGEPVEAA